MILFLTAAQHGDATFLTLPSFLKKNTGVLSSENAFPKNILCYVPYNVTYEKKMHLWSTCVVFFLGEMCSNSALQLNPVYQDSFEEVLFN